MKHKTCNHTVANQTSQVYKGHQVSSNAISDVKVFVPLLVLLVNRSVELFQRCHVPLVDQIEL